MKFCVKKSEKTTEKVIKGLLDLEKNKLEVGHFADQGYHPTAIDVHGNRMSYVDLMKFHHNGNLDIPPRPVVDIFATVKAPSLESGRYKRLIYSWSKQIPTPETNKALLEGFGKNMVKDQKAIFGDTTLLPVGGNPTPLVKTGELRKATTFKVREA